MKPSLPEFADVAPIIGKPFEILAHTSTALIQCGCEAGWPLMLVGVGTVVQCPACERSFAIAKAANLTVGMVGTKAKVIC